jgi:hypothetical protein
MKIYKDLNLKEIREKLDIDFAHFTYGKDQCSCCYGPEDMPKLYRKKGINDNEIKSYILFKNANNGSGVVTKYDYIRHCTYISWNLSVLQLEGVVKMLQEQLGDEYIVEKPENNGSCIVIKEKSLMDVYN